MINQAIQALLNEDKISGEAAEALREHAARAERQISEAMEAARIECVNAMTNASSYAREAIAELASAIAQHHSERSAAIAGIIGQPPVEFKQAAE